MDRIDLILARNCRRASGLPGVQPNGSAAYFGTEIRENGQQQSYEQEREQRAIVGGHDERKQGKQQRAKYKKAPGIRLGKSSSAKARTDRQHGGAGNPYSQDGKQRRRQSIFLLSPRPPKQPKEEIRCGRQQKRDADRVRVPKTESRYPVDCNVGSPKHYSAKQNVNDCVGSSRRC